MEAKPLISRNQGRELLLLGNLRNDSSEGNDMHVTKVARL